MRPREKMVKYVTMVIALAMIASVMAGLLY
jgi:hypothetical protein